MNKGKITSQFNLLQLFWINIIPLRFHCTFNIVDNYIVIVAVIGRLELKGFVCHED